MAEFKCSKCGAKVEMRCKPKKCAACGEVEVMVKQEEKKASGCGCKCSCK